MTQMLHFFRKDVRQHWPAILFSMAVQAVYVWDEPRKWLPQEPEAGPFRAMMSEYLPVLLMLAWCLLLVRVVQSESLVGDVQYWITRPVEWKVLLAEKLLFAAVFLELPLLIANLYLLIRGGFQPTASLTMKIVLGHAVFMGFVLVPLVALATVTAGIGQMALALIAVGVFAAGVIALTSYIPTQCFCETPDNAAGSVLFAACGAVVIWQYARRRTRLSRIILACAAVAMPVFVIGTPYDALLARRYPALNSAALSPAEQPMQFALIEKIPSERHTSPPLAPDATKDVSIRMPIRISGISADTSVAVDGSRLAVEAEDGSRWKSGWNYGGGPLFPDQQQYLAHFTVDKNFFNRVRSHTVKARASFAVTIWRDQHPMRVVATEGLFAMPDVGLCSIRQERYSNNVVCRFPVQGPTLAFLQVDRNESTCFDKQTELRGKSARAWGGNSESGPISSVGTVGFYNISFGLANGWTGHEEDARKVVPAVCPGTVLHISRPHEERRFSVAIDLPDLRLSDYRTDDPRVAGYGIAIGR
jgi:hypothetical protein